MRGEMFEPLLRADPSFEPKWREFLNEWGGERELPEYLALADLAVHLITKLNAGDTGAFEDVFEVVERWHVEGDDYVSEAASIGLLEDLQNTGLHKGSTTPEQFLPWLGPVSVHWWRKIDAFWQEGTPLRN